MSDLKEVYRQLVVKMNEHNLEEVGRFFRPDCNVSTPNVKLVGRDQVKAFFKGLFEAFPNLTVTLSSVLAEGSVVAVEYTLSGTHRGPFRTPRGEVLPATGREINYHIAEINEFENDQIHVSRVYADRVEQQMQLGLIPQAR